MTPATIVAALTSRKGLVLVVPAILLVGTVLAIGRKRRAPFNSAEQTPPPATTVGHAVKRPSRTRRSAARSARRSRASSRTTC